MISFWSMKALAHSLYQVDRADLSVHLAAVAALALTALAASLLPALRALAIEPAEALRDE